MARKKIAFVIVEGPSDEEALGVLLNRIYDKDTVFVQIMHKDITAEYGNSSANIIEDKDAIKPKYSLNDIRTCNVGNIVRRNNIKSANVNKLCSCYEIWGVSYRAFYMSCNLDHVLYNKLNSSDEEKENDSYKFAMKYKDNIPEFLDFISNSDFPVVDGYKESWDFIKQDLHSPERYTNLGLCFKEEK